MTKTVGVKKNLRTAYEISGKCKIIIINIQNSY
jgi:hypothetical protein